MSIVMAFELNNTYGTHNEDIAKKNKYTAVQVSKDVVVANSEDSQHDYIAEMTQQTEGTDNLYKTAVGDLWGDPYKTAFTEYRDIKTAVAQLYYKTYNITLDLSQPDYSSLLTVTSAPVFDWSFSGLKYEEKYNEGKEGDEQSGEIEKNYNQWNSFLNSPISRDPFGLVSGHSSVVTPQTFSVTDNMYERIVDGETKIESALQDILSNIQNAFNTTKSSIFENFYDYVKPVISGWHNNGTTITFSLRIPYKMKIYDSQWLSSSEDEYRLGGLSTKKVILNWVTKYWATYNYYEYEFNEFKIRFYNKYEISGTNEVTYYSGNRVFNANGSFLFAEGNKFNLGSFAREEYSQKFAEEIYENYQNGKTLMDIKYPLGPMYDDMGNQLFYIKDIGIVRKIEGRYVDNDGNAIEPADSADISEHIFPEEGMKCMIKSNGIPITKTDGTNDIQYYYVQNANLNYNGIALNELTLAQSETEPEDYILIYENPEHGELDIRDMAHNRLYSGARIVKGQYLDIYLTTDSHYGLPEHKLYVNGEEAYFNEANNYWRWTITGNARVVAPVVYLGGKYLHLDIDSDDITMKSGLVNGMEIFTNEQIQIAGNVSSGLTPRFLIDGVKQTITPSYNYDFSKNVIVENKDIYVSVKTTSLARTVTVTFDDPDAPANPSQHFYRIYSSEINPNSAGSDIDNNGTVYVGDKVSRYAVTMNTGYSISGLTETGLESVDGTLYEVVGNVTANYETAFGEVESDINLLDNAIQFRYPYDGGRIKVFRTTSKCGAPLGEIQGVRFQESYSQGGQTITKTGYRYALCLKDTAQINLELYDGRTSQWVFVETTLTLTPMHYLTPDTPVYIDNGGSITLEETVYEVSADTR